VGHEKLINKTIEHAAKHGHDHYIFVSHSHDAQRNPLSPDDKASYIKSAVKKANIHVTNKEMSGPLHIASHLNKMGYTKLHMVVGADRVADFKKKLDFYNGTSQYKFDHIRVISAGDRDPDAEGVEGMSGTKMRLAAINGEKDKFKGGLMSGLKNTHREEIYNKVRGSMSLRDEATEVKRLIPFLLMTEKQKADLIPLAEGVNVSIMKKSELSGIPVDELEAVYRRSLFDWTEMDETSLEQTQYAMACVNQYLIREGKRIVPEPAAIEEAIAETISIRKSFKNYLKDTK
jgi:hypothetical protein